MKSYFASYLVNHGAEPRDSTILIFDKNLSIGYRNDAGVNEMESWLIKEVDVVYDLPTQQTKITHSR